MKHGQKDGQTENIPIDSVDKFHNGGGDRVHLGGAIEERVKKKKKKSEKRGSKAEVRKGVRNRSEKGSKTGQKMGSEKGIRQKGSTKRQERWSCPKLSRVFRIFRVPLFRGAL